MATYDVTALSTALEFDTTAAFGKSIGKLPTLDRVIMAWYQSTSILYVQCFNVNTGTGAVTAIGSPIDIEPSTTATNSMASIVVIDDSNAVVFWSGSGDDGYAQLISIDGSGNVSTNGSALEYDTGNGTFMSAILWDSTHALNTWSGVGNDGFAAIFVFDTGAGTISVVGTPFEFDVTSALYQIPIKLNSTKFLQLYRQTGDDLYGIVLDVNSSTYAVTAAGSAAMLVAAAQLDGVSGCFIEDNGSTIKVASIIKDGTGTYVSSHSVDTSTWAVTTQNTSSSLGTSTSAGTMALSVNLVDSETLLAFYRGSDDDGFASTIAYTTGSGIGSAINTIEFDTANFDYATPSAATWGNGFFVSGWAGNASDGYIQAFQVEMPGPSTTIKTYTGVTTANVKTIYNGTAIANRKTWNDIA